MSLAEFETEIFNCLSLQYIDANDSNYWFEISKDAKKD